MKKILLTACLLLSIYGGHAQNENATEKSIRSILQKQEEAWNKHNIDAMSNFFTDDATLVNFLGMFWKSKTEIHENLLRINEDVFKHTSINLTLKQLKMITPDIAVTNVEEQFNVEENYTDMGQQYKKGDKNYKLIINVFIRKNNDWKITASQITIINQLVAPHQ